MSRPSITLYYDVVSPWAYFANTSERARFKLPPSGTSSHETDAFLPASHSSEAL